jgi:surface protein
MGFAQKYYLHFRQTSKKLPFVLLVKSDNTGTSDDNQFQITGAVVSKGTTFKVVYSPELDLSDRTTVTLDVSNPTITFPTEGNYVVEIYPPFRRIRFDSGGDSLKVLEIQQWGDIQWSSMENAFAGCVNMQGTYLDTPNFSNCVNAESMFFNCSTFNHTVNNWKIEEGLFTSLRSMFNGCTQFNQPVNNWNMTKFINVSRLFLNCTNFNQPLNDWDTSNLVDINSMFTRCTNFNQPLNNWNTSSIILNTTNAQLGLFLGCIQFNQDLSNWDLSRSTSLAGMFNGCTNFNNGGNPNISNWDISNCINFITMFAGCSNFNQPLDNWNFTTDVTKNITMGLMFEQANQFNQNIGSWNTERVISMVRMFNGCTNFNNGGSDSINNWNVSNVVLFGTTAAGFNSGMFTGAVSFNQPLNNWNVGSATNLQGMFRSATAFNQDISDWDVSNVTNFLGFMSAKLPANYNAEFLDNIYNKWSLLTLQPNITIDFNTIKYTAAGQAGKDILEAAPNNWIITDGGI